MEDGREGGRRQGGEARSAGIYCGGMEARGVEETGGTGAAVGTSESVARGRGGEVGGGPVTCTRSFERIFVVGNIIHGFRPARPGSTKTAPYFRSIGNTLGVFYSPTRPSSQSGVATSRRPAIYRTVEIFLKIVKRKYHIRFSSFQKRELHSQNNVKKFKFLLKVTYHSHQ
jgi:hypothetical protein